MANGQANHSSPSNPAPSQQQALDILLAEHHALETVLDTLLGVVTASRQGPINQRSLDCQPIRLMLDYIRTVPDRLHHPKEDQTLFARLRQRTGEFDQVLDKLSAQHREGERWLQKMEAALDRFDSGFPPAFLEFAGLLETYCDHQVAHLRLEETIVFPAASACLLDEDWADVAAAFGANGDPRYAAEEKNEAVLYGKIARLDLPA
ncbi:hemerythrin domain-containing protein [Noviherbaspirillum galbum]|uniref:Hemerythrin domain-containing protein n=1 Tax=Noviherbaspirillum galbum TaxID=2709383 RepID=A0A6B3SJT2_9BURK|nr:hemerythrin domain-containing protein [Noviherbaspirillum galbum]NEX61071.1 hemerythrin domain-containing protein [Noviherbaspirillum galbum]